MAAYGAPPPMGPGASEPAPPSAARVDVSAPEFEGGLASDPDAPKTLAAATAGLRACYEKALQNGQRGAGTVKFKIAVSAGGTVLRVETPRTGTVPGSATSCMITRLGVLQFNVGKPSTIQFSAECAPPP